MIDAIDTELSVQFLKGKTAM